MNTMWILWGWLITIPASAILVTRYALWYNYDEFVSEIGPALFWVFVFAVLWPVVITAFLFILVSMPRDTRKRFLADITSPQATELHQMSKEDLVGEVILLRKKLDNQAEKQVEELRKQYAKSSK